VDSELKIWATNISTELAIKSKKEKKPNEVTETVPEEYWNYNKVFQEEEATTLPPHRPGVDREINLEKGKGFPLKMIYPLRAIELKELHQYIRTNERIRESFMESGFPIMFIKKKYGKPRLSVDYRELNNITKRD